MVVLAIVAVLMVISNSCHATSLPSLPSAKAPSSASAAAALAPISDADVSSLAEVHAVETAGNIIEVKTRVYLKALVEVKEPEETIGALVIIVLDWVDPRVQNVSDPTGEDVPISSNWKYVSLALCPLLCVCLRVCVSLSFPPNNSCQMSTAILSHFVLCILFS
jgi:hypothetical protein